MLSTRDPLQIKRHRQVESKRLEKDIISCKWKQTKKAKVAIHTLDKIGYNRRKRRTLLNDKRIIPTRGHNFTHFYTKHRNTQIYKANIDGHEGKINSTTVVLGDFNTPLISIDTYLPGRKPTRKRKL